MPALIIGAQRAGVAVALLAAGLVTVGPPGIANARNDNSGVVAPNPVLHKYGDAIGGNQLFMIWGPTSMFPPDITDGTNGGYPGLPLDLRYDVGVQPQGVGYAMPPPPLGPPPATPIVMPDGQTAAPQGGEQPTPAEAPQPILPAETP